jgi:putative two-component system response regulator
MFLIAATVVFFILAALIITLYRSRLMLKRELERHKARLDRYRGRFSIFESMADIENTEREFETINRLVAAIEYRDIETANHIVRMAHYSRLIAGRLFPSDSPMMGLIFLAAPMHDVGKIGISDKILGKPRRLDHSEYEEMKRHTLIGHDILKGSSSPVIRLGAKIALTHHERYDGSGYPRGLEGEEIPIAGRIVAVADSFDALVSHRVYKEAWPIERALEEIKKQSGTYFDPVCVDALFESLDEILKIKDQYRDYIKNAG